jgi:hypothetical protein
MEIIDSILSLYDKKACDCYCCSCNWVLTEADRSAILKKLTLFLDGATFGIIDNDFYKGLNKTTCDRSSFLTDNDCDGVSFCEKDGKMHLLFVDLKSSYSNIEKAFKQNFFTLLKMHMFFSLCNGYNIENLTINFFVACSPFKDKDQKSDILLNLNMADELGNLNYSEKCLLNHLHNGKETIVTISELPFVKSIKLNESIISSPIHLHIYAPESYGESEGTIDLCDYL